MDGVGQILNPIVQAGNDSLLGLFLDNLDEHQTFWTDPKNDLDTIFSKISALLANAGTRNYALKTLHFILPHCPLEIVEEKAQHYINVCEKVCNLHKSPESITLVYAVLKQLLLHSINSAELRKLLSSNLSTFILHQLETNFEASVIPHFLTVLELAMRHYSGVCGALKTRIEQFLYGLVDATDSQTVLGTATCMLLLQQIRGGGQHGTLHKKTWEEYYGKLVDTIHDLLNKVFAHTPETFDEQTNLECLKLPALQTTDDPLRTAQLVVVRANNLIVWLEHAIVGAYAVPKPIAPFKALNLVLRGLSVTCGAMSKNLITENVAFGTFLPTIQHSMLAVMDGLINTLGSHMLIFAELICDAYVKCLRATQNVRHGASGQKKNFTQLRAKVYASIAVWCERMNYSSSIENVNEQILEHIVRDITPFVGEVTLKMDANSLKRLSSKAKKKLQKERNAATALNQAHSNGAAYAERKEQLVDTGNEELCREALKCLTIVLQSAGCFIKPVTHKLLQERIVPLCFSLVTTNQSTRGLYRDPSTRVGLLRSFAALITNPHHRCPPPLQYAMHIFTALRTADPSIEVRSVAGELARSAELIIHPWKETLYFPVELASIKEALTNKERQTLAKVLQETEAPIIMESVKMTKPSPSKVIAVDDMLDDSEGEINESLAVTEASEESEDRAHVDAIADEPEGWVEEVSNASSRQLEKATANGTTVAVHDTGSYNDGIIRASTPEDKVAEPSIVSIEDSDEEHIPTANIADGGDEDDDDVVEVPLDEESRTGSTAREGGKKHSLTHESNGTPSKMARLSDATNANDKNVDDIVAEMVAEFVDEP
ncbi:proline-, glutamic acid- and leucine-rich protein 1-like [Anopheles albimanus]|uniref:Pre-rRNA-processing protein RIX1 N-terminal domain-containing protein n=1 Tax=Anopheles albimanus TaxID=7167 RepID=A0A182FPQ2_ANOAL|nr:proline-, glutamic acid- and leucine-rich protein 1-like [Anopheles albimanus]